MAENPYAAPRAHVADAGSDVQGEFVAEGRAVPAGNGWTWITEAFSLFRQQPVVWILIVIIFVAMSVALSAIPVLGRLAVQLLTPVFTGGIMLGCRAMDEGGEMGVGSLFAGFSVNGGRLALLGLASMAAVAVVLLLVGLVLGMGGALLGFGGNAASVAFTTTLLAMLIVLALTLPIYMALWFAPALIALNDLTIGAALAASFRGCLRNVVPFLVYGAVAFVFLILASIPLGLGLLVMIPVLFASVYTAYRDIYYAR
ncbi:MAG TPA: BPSS1780 family membrane protein [Burkholderiales bacterium]|nr:BPSS1780 family membrane protein [Burkholderiales bacterium]